MFFFSQPNLIQPYLILSILFLVEDIQNTAKYLSCKTHLKKSITTTIKSISSMIYEYFNFFVNNSLLEHVYYCIQ